ncbi:hypothetical protein Hamer_G024638 [Homarus americanus]|uniref:Uncharacterized protein n=1 Tax=Homarus americanus TaxID=6706 RepID=A0A8J5JBY8_HOMAM|nr:hypothetical protein Hamer_G024638 [Homarus americanus]
MRGGRWLGRLVRSVRHCRRWVQYVWPGAVSAVATPATLLAAPSPRASLVLSTPLRGGRLSGCPQPSS